MAITKKQRNLLIASAGVLVACFLAPSTIGLLHRAAHRRQQALHAALETAMQNAQAQAKSALPAPSARTHPSRFTTVSNFSGIWQGQSALSGRGLCTLRLELREPPGAVGRYAGYSTLSCLSVPALMSRALSVFGKGNRMNPTAMILSGTAQDGSIRFHVVQTIGADALGCITTSFTVTPFGTNQIAVQWQEWSCEGGEMLLARAGR